MEVYGKIDELMSFEMIELIVAAISCHLIE